jgi:nitroreductase
MSGSTARMLVDVMPVRRSCRAFSAEAPRPVAHSVLRDGLASLAELFPGVTPGVHVVGGDAMHRVLPGLIGSYGKVRAPQWLLVTGPAADERRYEAAGYALEPLVLALTAVGVGTCWIGGKVDRDVFREVATYPTDHAPTVVIAFGDPARPDGHVREAGTAARKELADLLLGPAGDWTDALEAARTAPSAGNLQPWRFLPDGDRLHAYAEVKVPLQYRFMAAHLAEMSRLDVGIALSHVRLTLEAADAKVVLAADGPTRRGLTYIATMTRCPR